jgi:hypothetical protein
LDPFARIVQIRGRLNRITFIRPDLGALFSVKRSPLEVSALPDRMNQLDPNEILKEIRARKRREADEMANRESAERNEAEREKMALSERAVLISDKLKEIREILDKRANMLEGFSSQSKSDHDLFQGAELVTQTHLIVTEYPQVVSVKDMNAAPKNFVLGVSGSRRDGVLGFWFFHQGATTDVEKLLPQEVDETRIEQIFLEFVRWFGERAY